MRRLLIDDDSLISSQEALCFYTKANIVKYQKSGLMKKHKESMKKIKELLKKKFIIYYVIQSTKRKTLILYALFYLKSCVVKKKLNVNKMVTTALKIQGILMKKFMTCIIESLLVILFSF